jgi:preprotein translocase subunit SecA
MFQIPSSIAERDISPFSGDGLRQLIVSMAQKAYADKEASLGAENMQQLQKMILLSTIDHLWKDHLLAMDHLREGIGLQGYGQKDPLIEYKKQGFKFFEMMMQQITGDVIRKLFSVQLAPADELLQPYEEEFEQHEQETAGDIQYNIAPDGTLIPQGPPPGLSSQEMAQEAAMAMTALGGEAAASGAPAPSRPHPEAAALDLSHMMRAPRQMSLSRGPVGPSGNGGGGAGAGASSVDKVGRNDPCPCGSGKKYKKCHGS